MTDVELFAINTMCGQPLQILVVAYPYGVPSLLLVKIPIPSEEELSTSLMHHILRWICFATFHRSSFLLELYLVLHVVFVTVQTVLYEILQSESSKSWRERCHFSLFFNGNMPSAIAGMNWCRITSSNGWSCF